MDRRNETVAQSDDETAGAFLSLATLDVMTSMDTDDLRDFIDELAARVENAENSRKAEPRCGSGRWSPDAQAAFEQIDVIFR